MNSISQDTMTIDELSFFQNSQDIIFIPEFAPDDFLTSPLSADFPMMPSTEYNFIKNMDMEYSSESSTSSPIKECFSTFYHTSIEGDSSDYLTMSTVQPELIDQLPSSRSLQAKRTVSSKAYSCPVCSLSFSRKNSMNRHVLSHINVRPYTCTPCNRSFKRADIFKRHCDSNRCQRRCSLPNLTNPNDY